MKKRKRIIAILLAATLVMSGALLAGASELDDSQTTDDSQETEEADAETVETVTDDEDAVAEEETVVVEESVTDEDVSDVDDSVEMEVGKYTGMKEIAEIDPDLLGPVVESDGGIQTLAITPYTYKYTYTTLDFSSTGGRSGDAILDMAVELIVGNEGGYNTVTPNDNGSGAMSIGKIQWWADSALLLARLIVAEDNQAAYTLLGESLYDEITSSSTSWSQRTLNDSEATKMKNFLDPDKNPASKTIQDKLARSYIAVYVNHGYGLGIRNAAALVYYADIENQYGYSGGKMGAAKACAEYAYNIAESWSSVTLNELHLAAISNVAHNYTSSSSQKGYINRRRSTYGELVSSGWTYCNSGDYTIPYDENGYAGAAWLKSALNIYRNAGLTVNNSYDDALKSAVKSYQKAIGVTQDGMAGRYTSTKLIHDMYYTSMQTKGAAPKIGGSGTDIVKINGTWTYTVNGEPDYSYTGLAKNSNGWYYIKNGVLDRSYTGFAKNENGSWYITNGKLTRKDNSVLKDTKGAIGAKNEWYYVVGSKVQYNYTGFASNENGSWYMTNGKLTRKDDTVLKDTKGAIGAKNTWYYVVGSKVQSDFTGLANYKNSSGWWYITKGKVDRSVNTVAKNKNGWYYVVNGKVQKDFTGLANYKNSSGWWYITNGRVDRTYTGIAQNKNGWYYIKNGKVQKSFSGTVTIDGTKYSVTNGKVAK